MIRHKFLYRAAKHPVCECGYDPAILLELETGAPPSWFDVVTRLKDHLKKARRWHYRGVETHYGYRYHLWQNELTQRKFAWETETYALQNTSLWVEAA